MTTVRRRKTKAAMTTMAQTCDVIQFVPSLELPPCSGTGGEGGAGELKFGDGLGGGEGVKAARFVSLIARRMAPKDVASEKEDMKDEPPAVEE